MENNHPHSMASQIYAEQVRLLYKPFILSFITTPIAAILFVAIQWPVIEHKVLWACLASIILVSMLRGVLAYGYKKAKPGIDESAHWGHYFIIGAGAAGLCWGLSGIFMFPKDNVAHQLIAASAMWGVSSAAVTSLSVIRRAAFSYIAPAMLPVLLLFLMEDSRLGYIFSLMIALGFIFLIKGADNIYKNTRNNILLRIEGDEREKILNRSEKRFRSLIEQSPLSTQIFSKDGRTILVNKAWEGLWGANLEALENYNVLEDPQLIDKGIVEYLKRGFAGKLVEIPAIYYERDKTPTIDINFDDPGIWVKATIYPVKDGEGNICEVVLVHEDVSASKQAELELIAAREDAVQANETKTDFLSKMSHELRTPMNAIIGFSQLMRIDKDEPLRGIQKDNLNEIDLAANHLMRLINEILDLARIESGKMQVKLGPVSISDVLASAKGLIHTQAKERNIEILDHVSDKDIVVVADSNRLTQVLLNLLSNAVKYNHESGTITLTCNIENNKRVRINVVDTGAGLTQEQIEKLFVAFSRIDENEHIDGVGIGLVITKHLTELMSGNVGVESTTGEGSTFWVELDLSVIQPASESFPDDMS